jgi:hypothetical protein
MKATTAYALAWVSCAAAVCTAIAVTHSLAPLWAMLIPALVSVESGADK